MTRSAIHLDQCASLIAAIKQAVRAGFSVTFQPARSGGVEASIKTVVRYPGRASDRVEPFTVTRDHFRDAAGNALSVVVLECGADDEAQREALAVERREVINENERLFAHGRTR